MVKLPDNIHDDETAIELKHYTPQEIGAHIDVLLECLQDRCWSAADPIMDVLLLKQPVELIEGIRKVLETSDTMWHDNCLILLEDLPASFSFPLYEHIRKIALFPQSGYWDECTQDRALEILKKHFPEKARENQMQIQAFNALFLEALQTHWGGAHTLDETVFFQNAVDHVVRNGPSTYMGRLILYGDTLTYIFECKKPDASYANTHLDANKVILTKHTWGSFIVSQEPDLPQQLARLFVDWIQPTANESR